VIDASGHHQQIGKMEFYLLRYESFYLQIVKELQMRTSNIYAKGLIAPSLAAQSMYVSAYKASNNIHKMGMYHLSMANWSSLNTLNLGKMFSYAADNKIRDKGCKYLSRMRLNSIKNICLCT
jgi:hypothetical protein